jgi:hypothetical protein
MEEESLEEGLDMAHPEASSILALTTFSPKMSSEHDL